MFEKNMRMAYLLDFYEGLLDRHTFEVMKQYYNDDLSLAEIASDVGISRQGIRHLVKRGEEQLEFFDEKLHLASRYSELSATAAKLRELKENLISRNMNAEAQIIDEAVVIIMKGN